MNIPDTNAQLTYCLNVHRGETPEDMQSAVFDHARRVFDLYEAETGVHRPRGLGIWLSRNTAAWLMERNRIAEFANRLDDSGMYVFTINGFPYGNFHGQRVKEAVYHPDWSTADRRTHTRRLADLLAALLPEGAHGTISSVPVTYRDWATPQRLEAAVANIATAIGEMEQVEESTGRHVQLLLEPEPDCVLDDSESVLGFVRKRLRPALEHRHGTDHAADLLRRHFGVCLDMAHCAVVCEKPSTFLERCAEEGIPVGKIHLSAAVRSRSNGRAPTELEGFDDDVYLHQTRVRTAQGIRRFADLSDALAVQDLAGEWRVHFHVPLVWEGTASLHSTRELISPEFLRRALSHGVRHFEVETYTLSLLEGDDTVADGILADELLWVQQRMKGLST